MISSLLLILFSFYGIAHASCTDVDLNTSPPMSEMKTLDQGETSTCYAHSASQLLEYKLKKEGVNITPSPIDLSILINKNDLDEGGFVHKTLEKVSEKGILDRACVLKQIREFTSDGTVTPRQYAMLVQKVSNDSNWYTQDAGELITMKKRLESDKALEGCKTNAILDSLFESGMWGKSVVTVLQHVVNPCEKDRKKIKNLKFDFLESGDDSKFSKVLDEILDSNRPVGVSLCSQILRDKKKHQGLKGAVYPFTRNLYLNMLDCSPHAVLATARRKNGNTCEYMIRNSWGGDWDPKGLDCACHTSKSYYKVCPKKMTPEESITRVYVGCWISRDNLLPNTMSIVGIK